MPARRSSVGVIDNSLCRRCQFDEPVTTVRTEALCKACVIKYVSTKIIKRMESFRVRPGEAGKEHRLLLPLSLGPCSTVMLHVLSQHLKGQAAKTGRTGFKLHVLHILVDGDNDKKGSRLFDDVQQRYNDHAYSAISQTHITMFSGMRDLQQRINPLCTPTASDDLRLASYSSATSQRDFTQIAFRKLVVAFAKQHGCEAILWGDSMTRLAERTLAETAKGRGASIPWAVADGESPMGLPFFYPQRDLLRSEIVAVAALLEPQLHDVSLKQASPGVSISWSRTAIDDLISQYLDSVEKDYPSIVANVVKTTGKLQPAPLHQIEQQCELCEMPLDDNVSEQSRLCHGCIRTLSDQTG